MKLKYIFDKCDKENKLSLKELFHPGKVTISQSAFSQITIQITCP